MSEQNEVHVAISEALRTSIMVAMQAADLVAQQRMEKARQAQRVSDQQAREISQRMRAEREAAAPVMRRVWDDRWWRRADPGAIRDTWQITAGWAGSGDPYAQASLREMRAQLARRHGVVDLPDGPEAGAHVAALLGASADSRAMAKTAEEFAAPDGVTYGYRIIVRGPDGVEQVVKDGQGYAPQGLDAAEVADARMREWLAEQVEEPQARIEVYDAARGPGASLYAGSREQAAAQAGAPRTRRARIVAGEERVGADEMLVALGLEARETWERMNAQEQRLTAESGRDEAAWPASEREAIRDARARLAHLNLRRRMVEAEQRGESGAHVAQAAVLNRELDEQWWETVSRVEAAGVWAHVTAWQPSQARQGALASLEAGIHRRYGVEVPQDASGAQVLNALDATHIAGERDAEVDAMMARARDEETAATTSADTANDLRHVDASARQVAAEDEHAAAMSGLAEQDAQAAAALAAMSDPEAAKAVMVAAEGFTSGAAARATAPRRGGPSRSPARGVARPVARTRVRRR